MSPLERCLRLLHTELSRLPFLDSGRPALSPEVSARRSDSLGRRGEAAAAFALMRGVELLEDEVELRRVSNVLSLKWIKGEPTPSRLVDDILRGLGLERETEMQVRQRRSSLVTSPLGVGSRPSTGHATMGGGVK